VGVANAVTLVAVKVLDDRGAGTVNSVVAGINHATNSQLPNKILSMSLGGGRVDAIDSAVASATNAGVLVVVAAGNSNVDACNTSPGEDGWSLRLGPWTGVRAAMSSWALFQCDCSLVCSASALCSVSCVLCVCSVIAAREPSALTVGATRITDAKSSFSNFGPCVDIWAPGEGIRSAVADRRRTDTYAVLSGTSMAGECPVRPDSAYCT
jgi:cerevisin